MALLFVILEQTTTEQPTTVITIKRFEYTEWYAAAGLRGADRLAVRGRGGHVDGLPDGPLSATAAGSAAAQGGAQALRRARLRHCPPRVQRRPSRPPPSWPKPIAAAAWSTTRWVKPSRPWPTWIRPSAATRGTASAYLERGKLRTESGDFDGALADFGQLMVIRADDPDTLPAARSLPRQEGALRRRRRRFSPGAQAHQPFRLRRARQGLPSPGSRRPSR